MSPSTTDELILAPNGEPFKSIEAAEKYLKNKELNDDIFGLTKEAGGWAIAKHRVIADRQAKELQTAPPATAAKTVKMKYLRIKVQAKGSPNDLDHVPLSLNMVERRVMRGQEAILPENFVQLMEDAKYTAWETSTDPEQPLKNAGEIQRFPFSIIGEATEEEYEAMLASGNAITMADIAAKRKQAT